MVSIGKEKPRGLLGRFLEQEVLKRAVWDKGHLLVGDDPAVRRRDDAGYIIRYTDYGNRDSAFGWEIDHIQPIALGGSNELDNLRPLHWLVNARRGGLLGGKLS